MNRSSFTPSILVLMLAACPSVRGELDDEAGTTTSPGESESTDDDKSSTSSSSSTSTSTDEGSESDTETDGGFFVPHTDLSDGHFGCDPFAQDCPESEKCVAYAGRSWQANKCVLILGDGEVGETCILDGFLEATDSCDVDSACWNVREIDGQLVGTCKAFCDGTADNPICAEGYSCLITDEGTITLCIENCDLVLQDCPEGLECVPGSPNQDLGICIVP